MNCDTEIGRIQVTSRGPDALKMERSEDSRGGENSRNPAPTVAISTTPRTSATSDIMVAHSIILDRLRTRSSVLANSVANVR